MTTVTQAPAAAAEGHIDPAAAFVPVQTSSERPTSFDPADFGAPTGREVNWKHTPIARLGAVLVDEDTSASEAVEHRLDVPEALRVVSVGHEAAVRGEVFRPEDVAAAIAWKQSPDALHLRIPANEEHAQLLRVDLVGRDARAHGNDHVIVEAMPNSAATVLLYHSGSAQYAQNVEIIVRVNPSVELAGAGSECKLYGVSFSDAGQHLESQVYMHHKGPHTKGDVLYKGALQGESARSVWIGDVLIGPDASGTDSYEANRNLVLTDGARAESIPNLEIETGDIQGAGHASATGRFDDEQLFYLQARGIGEAEARRLVVLGFLGEIVQKTGIPSLEEELTAAILAELDAGEQE